MARPVAERLYRWGQGQDELLASTLVDFGIDSPVHEAALKEVVRHGATVEELDKALGYGRRITKLVKRYAPMFAGVSFYTSYDVMAGRT